MELDRGIVTAADYADALLQARRVVRVLCLLMILMLLFQTGLFFTARYGGLFEPSSGVVSGPNVEAVPGPTDPAPAQPADGDGGMASVVDPIPTGAGVPASSARRIDLLRYGSALFGFVGMGASIVLSLLLLSVVLILVAARTLGVGPSLGAYFVSLLLMVLMFPWHAFLGGQLDHDDFVIPGVLYTWTDVRELARFPSAWDGFDASLRTILRWLRFVGFPLLAVGLVARCLQLSLRGFNAAIRDQRS